ncbi:MAG TPA: hypothetical protein VE224_12070, partial [Pseudolabrys sp.]|nr:hypothetical protein [Pseudolabrys sp.]
VGLWLPLTNIYTFFYKNKLISRGGAWTIHRAVRYTVGFLFGIVGGAAMVESAVWSMYLATASYVVLLIAVVLNAWAIMVGIGQTDKRRGQPDTRHS